LYVITDPLLCGTARLGTVVAAAIRGGAAMVQYRDKTSTTSVRYQDVQTLVTLCTQHRVPLIINDDLELAASVADAGIHIGAEDISCAEARQRLGNDRIIGVSCYNSLTLAEQAVSAGADYVAFGSVFPSATKPHAAHASLDLLQRARSVLPIPIVAIGGITPSNARSVIEAGADMIAVISGVFGHADPEHAARQYRQVITPTR
jgi:thiamine-phosphate pyrophosphorylase